MTWGYGPSKRSMKFAYDAPFRRYFNFSEKWHFSEKASSQQRNVCSIQTFFIIKHLHKSNYCFNWTFIWYKKLYWRRKKYFTKFISMHIVQKYAFCTKVCMSMHWWLPDNLMTTGNFYWIFCTKCIFLYKIHKQALMTTWRLLLDDYQKIWWLLCYKRKSQDYFLSFVFELLSWKER